MQQYTRCAECGRPFDENVDRAAFQDHFKGQFNYDERRDKLCFACACLTAASGLWHSKDIAAKIAGQA